jgi:hypothetical protein
MAFYILHLKIQVPPLAEFLGGFEMQTLQKMVSLNQASRAYHPSISSGFLAAL